MRILTALLLLLPSLALAQDEEESGDESGDESAEPSDGAKAAGLDALLKSIPTVETKKSEQQVEEEKRAAFEAAQISFPDYVTMVQREVIAHWKPKAKLLKEKPPLRTELVVHVGGDGSIIEVGAVTMSGKKKFDKSALDAINATASLPVPPDSLAAAAAQGVVVVFTARSLQ